MKILLFRRPKKPEKAAVVTPGGRPRLATIGEAKGALVMDKFGSVYVRGDRVFVMTVHGAGEFSKKAWDEADVGGAL